MLKYLNWLRIDPLEEEVGMDISRHKGPAYESEGSAHQDAVLQLSMRRLELNNSDSQSGKGKSSKTENPENCAQDAEPETEVKPAEAADSNV